MKYVAAFALVAFVAIVLWGMFTKVGAHPLLIDAQYTPSPLIAPCPLDQGPHHPNPLKPQWKADA